MPVDLFVQRRELGEDVHEVLMQAHGEYLFRAPVAQQRIQLSRKALRLAGGGVARPL